MPLSKITTRHTGENLYSPFTGAAIDEPSGDDIRDPSVLFIYHGHPGVYEYISDQVREQVEDPEELTPEDLLDRLVIDGAFALEVHRGWVWINIYAFCPRSHDL